MARDLGIKHTCYQCGTKFYDLKKPAPICPKCGADQRTMPPPAPAERKRARPTRVEEEAAVEPEVEDEEDEDEEDEDEE